MKIKEPPPPVALGDDFDGEENKSRLPNAVMVYHPIPGKGLIQMWKRSGFGFIGPYPLLKGADKPKIYIN